MCGSMVDIQYPTAEIRRGKNQEERNGTKNIMSASTTQGGHNDYMTVLNRPQSS